MEAAKLYDFRRELHELMQLKKIMSNTLLTSGPVEPSYFGNFVNSRLDLHDKYSKIALDTMLSNNCRSFEDVDKVYGALVVLSKYALNLLQHQSLRPNGWNVIDFANQIFRERVCSVQGTQNILNKLGYQSIETQAGTQALVFQSLAQPNKETIAEIYIELFAGNVELINYLKRNHPNPSLIEKYLPFLTRPENNLATGKLFGTVPNADLGINLVEESKQKNENEEITFGAKELMQDNIPLMVLEQMVSIPPGEDATAAEFLAGENRCDICGNAIAIWTCRLCDNKNLCADCDKIWHQHPKRRAHDRISFGVQDTAAAAEIEVVARKLTNEVRLIRPDAGSNHPVFTLPTPALSLAYLTSSATGNFLPSKENSSSNRSPIFPLKLLPPSTSVSSYTLPSALKAAAQSRAKAVINSENRDDDFNALLMKAKHPPAFYQPPMAAGALRQTNGEFITLASVSTHLPVSNVNYRLPLMLSNARFDQTSRPRESVAGSVLIASKSPHLTAENAVGIREKMLDRSASASGILSGITRGTNHTAIQEAQKLHWNCEFCTFMNSGMSRICTMCNKTNDNLQKSENDVHADNTAATAAATSPSHLARAASAYEPLTDHKRDSNHSASVNPQFVSKFVEIQDEIYHEKKIAQERFQREQSQMLNSQSVEDMPTSGNHAPKPKVTVSGPPKVSETPRRSVEHLQPGNSAVQGEGHTPGASYSIDRKHFTSRFVDLADQIYIEKKAAQEQFHQMEIENASRVTDDVEFKRAQRAVFQSHGGVAANSYLKQATPTFRDSVKMEGDISNTLSMIEQLERQRKIQDMFNEGLAVVRLFKAVETKGYSDSELRVILSMCGTTDPCVFHQDRWSALIVAVLEKLQEQSIVSKQSSPLELVRLSLAKSGGVVEIAVTEFKNLWHQRVEIILRDCGLEDTTESKRQVISILDESGGDVESAKTIFIRERFLKHIWNEDGQTDGNTEIGIDDDIYQRTTKHLNSDLSKILVNTAQSIERRTRMILAETDLPGWQRAMNVLTILEEPSLLSSESTLIDIVDAVKNCGAVEESRQFLNQSCEICFDNYPCRLIKSMGCCQCKICSTCAGQYFEVVIRERFVRNLVCPVCSLPEIDTGSEQTETHFQFLLLMLRNMVTSEIYELFQMKLRDWNLMMDPSFRWCASNNCKSGFLTDPDQLQNKISCPHCRSFMCQQCKKPWEDQHSGLNCEEFQSWKENNDPEVQALGLARHLEENGIECPRCKCRYSLAKGGCMHFTCIQCRHEFCSGCLQPFRRGQNCTLLRSCAKAGLHCHHPRDCLFYLRDRDVTELQQLLQDNGVAYDTEPSQTRLLAGPDGQRCSVMEQKQTQNGFKDETCGKEVPQNFAGLCEIHYKEYLVGLTNKNSIDPAKIMKQEELIILLNRVEKKVPKKRKGQTSEEYEEFLLKMVQDQLPLAQRQIHQMAQENNDTVLDPLADVTDGQINMRDLRLDGEELIGRGGVHRTLLMAFGMPPNHTLMPHIKDSGYSSLTITPNLLHS